MTYTIEYSNGDKDRGYATEQAARDAFTETYPDAVIGHDGDLSDGGERTLCWSCEANSVDDDGTYATASIWPGR